MSSDPSTVAAVHNPPVLTVSALSLALKHHVERGFGQVRVRGEISGYKNAASGHLYFALKDADALIDAVCWRTSALRLGIRPEDGMDVIVSGRLTTFPSRSKYQIIVDTMELAGRGALLKLLEDRRKALAAEGLFSEERKRKLPYLPETIGVVTSPGGAVIRDILHRFADRFPRRVLLWPVQVQGQGAAEQIAAAIVGFNALPAEGAVPRPDLLIVARGGGSLEDLWAFNEEIVVRAAAASDIPLISAVGHETDVTLIDFAADRRAPTPTAAAEMAVPVRVELLTQVQGAETRLASVVLRTLAERRTHVEGLCRGLPRPDQLLGAAMQRLDDRAEKLGACLTAHVARLERRVQHLGDRLASPQQRLERERGHLVAEVRMLRSAMDGILREQGHRLTRVADLLDSCSYQRTLRRGYVIAYNENGRLVTSIEPVATGDRLNLRFKDGEASALVEARSSGKTRPPTRRRTAQSDDQGTLF
jgi:exodeoxyribonuclease VII large subunit